MNKEEEKEVEIALKELGLCIIMLMICFFIGFIGVLLQHSFGLVVMISCGILETVFIKLYYNVKERGIDEVKKIKLL